MPLSRRWAVLVCFCDIKLRRLSFLISNKDDLRQTRTLVIGGLICSLARFAAVPLVKNVAYFSSVGREVLYAIYYDMITQHSII